MKMKLIQHVQHAVNTTAHKTSAALRLGAGVTGDVIATGTFVVGGTVAIAGAVVAAAGAATFAGGAFIMGQAGRLAHASQTLADKSYEDLVGTSPEAVTQERAEPALDGDFAPAMA